MKIIFAKSVFNEVKKESVKGGDKTLLKSLIYNNLESV